MKPPENMTAIIDRKRYSTETAFLLCADDYWDGHNWERKGTNTFLYGTPKGNYFQVRLTQWQGEHDRIIPVSLDEAISFFESCPENCQRVKYAEAFPGIEVEEA